MAHCHIKKHARETKAKRKRTQKYKKKTHKQQQQQQRQTSKGIKRTEESNLGIALENFSFHTKPFEKKGFCSHSAMPFFCVLGAWGYADTHTHTPHLTTDNAQQQSRNIHTYRPHNIKSLMASRFRSALNSTLSHSLGIALTGIHKP